MSRIEDFKSRMNNLKQYKNTTGKGYWDWKAQQFAVGGEVTYEPDIYADERTDHPIAVRQNLDRNINVANFTDRINHIDPNVGEYNPFYNAYNDTYGTVPLTEITVTAPWTQKGRNNAAARRGMHYAQQGLEDAAKVAAPIVAGAVLPAMSSTGLLGKAIDLASVATNPLDPLNYLPYTEVISKLSSNPALLPLYEFGSKIVHPIYEHKRNQKVKQMEDIIDKVNKWGMRYKYSKIPKSSAKNPEIAEELIKQRLVEHNTFARGVRDDYSHREQLNTLARKHFNLPYNIEPSIEQRLQVAATYYAPETGSGRAGFYQNYKGEGSLYTSNSLDTAKGYAMQQHRGENDGLIAIVNRPIDFSQPIDTWLLQADMPFVNSHKSLDYSTKELPYLVKTGQSINTAAKSLSKLNIPYKQIRDDVRKELINGAIQSYNNRITDLEIYRNRLLDRGYNINDFFIPSRQNYDDFKFIGPSVLARNNNTAHVVNNFNSILSDLHDAAYNLTPEDIGSEEVTNLINKYNDLVKYVYSDKFAPLGKSLFNKDFDIAYKKQVKNRVTDIMNKNKTDFLNTIDINNPYVPKIIDNIRPQGTSNMFTTENLRTSTRGQQDAYQHFIFTGPENTQALDFVKFIDPKQINTSQSTRSHVGKSTYGLSRKSK